MGNTSPPGAVKIPAAAVGQGAAGGVGVGWMQRQPEGNHPRAGRKIGSLEQTPDAQKK
jgi:hypothetical protein